MELRVTQSNLMEIKKTYLNFFKIRFYDSKLLIGDIKCDLSLKL